MRYRVENFSRISKAAVEVAKQKIDSEAENKFLCRFEYRSSMMSFTSVTSR